MIYYYQCNNIVDILMVGRHVVGIGSVAHSNSRGAASHWLAWRTRQASPIGQASGRASRRRGGSEEKMGGRRHSLSRSLIDLRKI